MNTITKDLEPFLFIAFDVNR